MYIPSYLTSPEDGDLSLKHVGGFMFTDSIEFYEIYVPKFAYKK